MSIRTNKEIMSQLFQMDQDMNSGLLSELFEIFMRDTPLKIEKLSKAVNGVDLKESERISHNLKSSFGNLGFEELHILSGKVQTASAAGEAEDVVLLARELIDKSAAILALSENEYINLCKESSHG